MNCMNTKRLLNGRYFFDILVSNKMDLVEPRWDHFMYLPYWSDSTDEAGNQHEMVNLELILFRSSSSAPVVHFFLPLNYSPSHIFPLAVFVV